MIVFRIKKGGKAMKRFEEYQSIPKSTLEAILTHVKLGTGYTGHFVTAVLENNLVSAVGHADSHNSKALPEIVRFLYNNVPAGCWGSPEKVQEWKGTEDVDVIENLTDAITEIYGG
jgi:hypothetical protein